MTRKALVNFIPAISAAPAVTVDQVGSKIFVNPTATSANYTGLTVGGGLHRAMILTLSSDLGGSVSPSAPVAFWDAGIANQPLSVITTSPNGSGTLAQVWLLGLVNPVSGNKTLGISWTTVSRFFISAISFINVDQATPFPNSQGDNNQTVLNITSAAGDMVVAVFNTGSATIPTGSPIYSDASNGFITNSFANYDNGASPTKAIGSNIVNTNICATNIKAG